MALEDSVTVHIDEGINGTTHISLPKYVINDDGEFVFANATRIFKLAKPSFSENSEDSENPPEVSPKKPRFSR